MIDPLDALDQFAKVKRERKDYILTCKLLATSGVIWFALGLFQLTRGRYVIASLDFIVVVIKFSMWIMIRSKYCAELAKLKEMGGRI